MGAEFGAGGRLGQGLVSYDLGAALCDTRPPFPHLLSFIC